MGTWEEESRILLESQNEISKDVSSDETYHAENDVVEVEVVNVNGDENDHVSEGVLEEDALVQQLERVDFGDSKIEEEKREEQGDYEEDNEEGKYQDYPLRPYAVDCSFYIKTGTCKFGENCRYNHPPKRGFQHTGYAEKGIEENDGSVVDAGKIECKYFPTPGGCKYGNDCRYNHSSHQIEKSYQELNRLGLPIRSSEQVCTFFLRNGSCGYGANCRFNHPDVSLTKEFESGNSLAIGNTVRGGISLPRNYAGQPLQSFGGVSQGSQELPNGFNLRNGSPYVPHMSSYSNYQSMRPNPGWNQSQVISPFPANTTLLPHQFSKRVDASSHYENVMQTEEFPERPGQPDCDYFMKTGSCKYRSACRYNHPRSRASKLQPPLVSSKGLYSTPAAMLSAGTSEFLRSDSNNMRANGFPSGHHYHHQQLQRPQNEEFPERPGEPECEYYMKTGQCKFNSACKYHHPRSRPPTQSHCALSEKGLPLRPGAKLCRNYEQEGMCKYGRKCLFDHPDDRSPALPVAANFHSSTNLPVAANLEPPAANTVNSAWDDNWGM